MQKNFVCALQARRARIRSRWEDLLRVERANSPLANPDTLVHLLDLTLDELLGSLESAAPKRRHHRLSEIVCPCGRNPLLVYFSAGQQAMREALVLAQAEIPSLAPEQRDIAFSDLESVLAHIARREIESFCAVCQFRGAALAHTQATVRT